MALVASSAGHLAEVNARGVVMNHVRQYREYNYHYVWLDLPDAGRNAAVEFARSSLGATIAFGDRIRMPDSGHGCVSLVARALQEAGIRFARKPTEMTPADLAKHFGVTP